MKTCLCNARYVIFRNVSGAGRRGIELTAEPLDLSSRALLVNERARIGSLWPIQMVLLE